MIKEACIENFSAALSAQLAGAARIELCENLSVGGTTPSYGTIKACIEKLGIPSFVMIRPRGGNFRYSGEELTIMEADIAVCKQLGVPAVVFGLLTPEGQIDEENTARLIALARPMQVTFHKAFDELADPFNGLEVLIRLGADRILTSGAKPTAREGAPLLNQLAKKADGRIILVAAGSVTAENLPELSRLIHTTEFHGKKIV